MNNPIVSNALFTAQILLIVLFAVGGFWVSFALMGVALFFNMMGRET